VASIRQVVTKDGGTIEIKLWDKIAALEKACKYLGMFIERKEIQVDVNYHEELKDLTDEELALAEQFYALRRRRAAATMTIAPAGELGPPARE
jgi:hypothetical protein